MSTQPQTLCLRCGRPFPSALGFCPVCLLSGAVAAEEESDEPSSEDALQVPTKDSSGTTRFEHYQLLQGPDGQPQELGRGAMGVTYQAVDLSLRRPVGLEGHWSTLLGR